MGPINPPRKRIGARYIITATDYLTIWAEETPLKDCTAAKVGSFIFNNAVTQFGCPNILISDQGTHLFN